VVSGGAPGATALVCDLGARTRFRTARRPPNAACSRKTKRVRSAPDRRAVVPAKTAGRQRNGRGTTELRHPARSSNRARSRKYRL